MASSGIERRGAARFAVQIEAQVTDLGTHATVESWCTEISLSGCYIKTPYPNLAGTPIWMRLEHGNKVFETRGQVAHTVLRSGMGIVFGLPVPEVRLTIVKGWIAAAGGGEMERVVVAERRQATARLARFNR